MTLRKARMKGDPDVETQLAFRLYIVYLISFFLHLPARLGFLGVIRFDFLLVGLTTFLILSVKTTKDTRLDSASRYLLAIFVFAILTLPVVEWPGSVINNGMVAFIKGAIFYFFTVNLVSNERRLKTVIFVFIACNTIRILEPLIMHVTTGYLGSATYLGDGDYAGRLAGAPSDTVNPNGLAFIIATVLPFLHYVVAPISRKMFALYVLLFPVLLYTMGLTLSRSGVLAIAIIAFGVFLKSKRKALLAMIGIAGLTVIFLNLNDIQRDRYLSLVSHDTRQSASAEGRIEGWVSDFKVAMNRPIIGHGLGTSREANWNVAGKDQISHILWAEIWQEIGLIGLILFILYLQAMIRNFLKAGRLIRTISKDDFLFRANEAMQVWLLMNLLFSLASYGLKSYEWYFFGGLSVVLLNMVNRKLEEKSESKSLVPVSGNTIADKYPLAGRVNEYHPRR
ncbi:O-antigen ligase family protein [Marinobacter sp. JSM 1782161]|uniref:O-antigen ligase family protein n=1 Tax=Marinobacter sp. JSM 1782161 TaxID=2685906 RepID=UPI0014042680|nr:O-antigen ligase family protein [Marinobacter sp. JSM 1782161]